MSGYSLSAAKFIDVLTALEKGTFTVKAKNPAADVAMPYQFEGCGAITVAGVDLSEFLHDVGVFFSERVELKRRVGDLVEESTLLRTQRDAQIRTKVEQAEQISDLKSQLSALSSQLEAAIRSEINSKDAMRAAMADRDVARVELAALLDAFDAKSIPDALVDSARRTLAGAQVRPVPAAGSMRITVNSDGSVVIDAPSVSFSGPGVVRAVA